MIKKENKIDAAALTCDPDRRLHDIVAAPGLFRRHQPISAEWQVLVVAGHQVPGDGALKQGAVTNRQQGKWIQAADQKCYLGLIKNDGGYGGMEVGPRVTEG